MHKQERAVEGSPLRCAILEHRCRAVPPAWLRTLAKVFQAKALPHCNSMRGSLPTRSPPFILTMASSRDMADGNLKMHPCSAVSSETFVLRSLLPKSYCPPQSCGDLGVAALARDLGANSDTLRSPQALSIDDLTHMFCPQSQQEA